MTGPWPTPSSPGVLAAEVIVFGALGLAVLAYDLGVPRSWRSAAARIAARITGRSDWSWIDAPLLTAVAAAAFAAVGAVSWASGAYGCSPGGGPSDLLTLTTSGQAFLHGGDPFSITACHSGGNPVPAGLASVLLSAVGSLGGEAGVLAVWGAVSVAIVPLLWSLGGDRRAVATVFVLVSLLYLPIVAVQVDGASLALVPLTVLLVLYLSRRGWPRAAAIGGFLATGRFPAIFPVLAVTGRAGPRRFLSAGVAVAVFGLFTGLTYAAYREQFAGPVFWLQFGRSHLALTYWAILQGAGWVEPSRALTVVQALLILGAVGGTWLGGRTELGTVSIVLVVTILLAQFLSFTELVFLLPVALVGPRARTWLWGIGVVAATNYLIALRSLRDLGRPMLLSYGLDVLLSALLLGLLVDLVVRERRGPVAPESPSEGAPAA